MAAPLATVKVTEAGTTCRLSAPGNSIHVPRGVGMLYWPDGLVVPFVPADVLIVTPPSGAGMSSLTVPSTVPQWRSVKFRPVTECAKSSTPSSTLAPVSGGSYPVKPNAWTTTSRPGGA